MSFVARALTEKESDNLNFGIYAIPPGRIPRNPAWTYATDEQRNAICTQLISSTPEVQDSTYYFFLAWHQKAAVFKWRRGHLALENLNSNDRLSDDEENEILKTAKEAIDVLDKYRLSNPIYFGIEKIKPPLAYKTSNFMRFMGIIWLIFFCSLAYIALTEHQITLAEPPDLRGKYGSWFRERRIAQNFDFQEMYAVNVGFLLLGAGLCGLWPLIENNRKKIHIIILSILGLLVLRGIYLKWFYQW